MRQWYLPYLDAIISNEGMLFKELNTFLDSLSGNNDAKVLIITGDGKAFIAGADLTSSDVFGFDKKDSDKTKNLIWLYNLKIPENTSYHYTDTFLVLKKI